MQPSRVFLPALPCLLAASAWAQLPMIGFSGGIGGGPDGIQGTATFNFQLRSIQSVVNAPYSGEQMHKTVQTLADGTHIAQVHIAPNQKVWRDSQGRVRIEQSLGGGGNNDMHFPTLVQIEDPVSGYIYVMDDVNKVVHRLKASVVAARDMDPAAMRARPQSGTSAAPGAAGGGGGGVVSVLSSEVPPAMTGGARQRPRIQTSNPEDLGTQTIDGVAVHGTRTASVIPTGTMGNDAPITTTRDTWFSPELNMVIQTVTTDPRSGVQTTGIANLSRIEPDPSLFMVPSDYTMVDEIGTFTIKWGTQ